MSVFASRSLRGYEVQEIIAALRPQELSWRGAAGLAALPFLTRIIVNGQWLKDQSVERWRLAPERVEVFPVIMSSRIREWAGAPDEDSNEILLFGRIHEYKGLGVMLNALPEAIEYGKTGLLVEPGDPAALADALTALLGDPDLRRRMGHRAYERRYGPGVEKALGERLCRVYEECLRYTPTADG